MADPEISAERNIPIGEEVVDKWNALPLNYEPSDLVDIPPDYKCDDCQDRQMLLRSEARDSLLAMLRSAREDGVDISVLSAYRSAEYQAAIYQRAIEKEGDQQASSAAPGHSEHQLGTAVDFTSREVDNHLVESFSETKAHDWLSKNAHQYGYHMSYTRENHRDKGYIWEPWHFRYWGNHAPE